MTINKINRWIQLPLISCLWFLAPASGRCFCNPVPSAHLASRPSAGSNPLSQREARPSAEVLRSHGALLRGNPYRFAPDCQDDENGRAYYGYRFYNASNGRWLNRDPMEEDGAHNLDAFVANDAVNYIDLLGLRDLTPQEQAVLYRLIILADGTKDKDPEFSRAMHAVIGDIKALIQSVVGPNDPANLQIGMSALKIWADPDKAKLYAHVGAGKNVTCNKYVADVVGAAGFDVTVWSILHGSHPAGTPEWHDSRSLKSFKVKWIIRPIKFDGKGVAVDWEQPLMGKGEGRAPTFGDVISYPGHVGVFLGRKIYISSTTWSFRPDLQGVDVIIHITNDNQEQIYRSPE